MKLDQRWRDIAFALILAALLAVGGTALAQSMPQSAPAVSRASTATYTPAPTSSAAPSHLIRGDRRAAKDAAPLRQAPTSRRAAPTTGTRTRAQAPTAGVFYANCAAARAAGAAPIYRGQPGYRPALDRDGDGIACE